MIFPIMATLNSCFKILMIDWYSQLFVDFLHFFLFTLIDMFFYVMATNSMFLGIWFLIAY